MKEYSIIKTIKTIVDIDLDIIGDDVAFIKESGMVLTCDTLVEDVHFRLSTATPFDIGYKSASVNLSDIAASGGICNYFLVSLALPKKIDDNFVVDFYKGLKQAADTFNTQIIGGDLTTSNKIVITVTAIGKSEVQSSRANALEGQLILVSGNFGSSFTGLQLLDNPNLENDCKKIRIENKEIEDIKIAHLRPFPRINEAQMLLKQNQYKNPCIMDTSDGLADALFQIAKKSNKRLIVDVSKIPFLKSVEKISGLMNYKIEDVALFGGEDFELITTCFEEDIANSKDITKIFSVIGNVKNEQPGVTLLYSDKKIELTESLLDERISFKHF